MGSSQPNQDAGTTVPRIMPYNGKVIRNLLYHLWPTKHSDCWRWNVAQLLRRMDQFNGQRIVSVVTDDSTVSFEEAQAAFAGTVKDFIHERNNPTLGESLTLSRMLRRVENVDPRQLTFYAHAKGVKYKQGEQPMVRPWSNVMYSSLLDYPRLIEDALLTKTFAGTFYKSSNRFDGLPPSFHFAGTFYWMRNAFLFAKDNWDRIAAQWWGSEAWPGVICDSDEVACLLLRGTSPEMSMYKRAYWKNVVTPAWERWQVERAPLRAYHTYAEVLRALKASGAEQVVVTGPQRSGTMIAAKMLADDLKLPFMPETVFDTHDHDKFHRLLIGKKPRVIQAPTMSAYVHLVPGDVPVVWMRRNLQDVLRSQERIGWRQHEQLERDRYFDRGGEPSAVIKTRAWESHQRIALGERAFDLDYESLRGHRLWVGEDGRKGFGDRQTCPHPSN